MNGGAEGHSDPLRRSMDNAEVSGRRIYEELRKVPCGVQSMMQSKSRFAGMAIDYLERYGE